VTAAQQQLNLEMPAFHILEHTADVGFEAFGATREELFANAGRALLFLITELEAVQSRDRVSIQTEGDGPASLMVNWLSEILYRYDAEGWLFCNFEIHSLTDRSLSAVARGEKFDPARHRINLLVKAITYHQLLLEHNAEGWRAQVYVDI
jgi:SHS2 domain-containing protein